MAEHPNVDVVRRSYQAFASGDLESLRALWTDDIAFHVQGSGKLNGDYHGPDEVFGMFAELAQETGGTFRLEVHAILADDEHSAIMLTQYGTRNGRTLATKVVHIGHLREGKTAEFWEAFTDPDAIDDFWA